MNLFGEDDSIERKPKQRAKSNTEVLSFEERRYVLSQIARGVAIDTWIVYHDSNLRVRLTPQVSERIKAIQVLNEMDASTVSEDKTKMELPDFFSLYAEAMQSKESGSEEREARSEEKGEERSEQLNDLNDLNAPATNEN